MRNQAAIHGAAKVLRDAAEHDAVRARRPAGVDGAAGEDGELEVGRLGVGEGEVLVVVVDVGVLVAACGG